MQPIALSELKALFAQLVDAIGTQDAAATFLGITRQRVGALISTATDDLPTVMQIVKLEAVCGSPVVTGALARRVECETKKDAITAAVHGVAAAAESLAVLHQITEDGIIEDGEEKLAQRAARKNLEAAQAEYDATMRLRPTLRVAG
jgi:hypothetical protein